MNLPKRKTTRMQLCSLQTHQRLKCINYCLNKWEVQNKQIPKLGKCKTLMTAWAVSKANSKILGHPFLAYMPIPTINLLCEVGILKDSPTLFWQCLAIDFICVLLVQFGQNTVRSWGKGRFMPSVGFATLKRNSIWKFFNVHYHFWSR